MTPMPVPSPFISADVTAETLPSEFSGKSHYSDGSFSIDEDSFLYAIDPPPLPREHVNEDDIEQILRALFARGA